MEKREVVIVEVMRSAFGKRGGAIAFGHPNGAPGARIAGFAIRQLIRKGGRYGLFWACCGGGQGVATIVGNMRL